MDLVYNWLLTIVTLGLIPTLLALSFYDVYKKKSRKNFMKIGIGLGTQLLFLYCLYRIS